MEKKTSACSSRQKGVLSLRVCILIRYITISVKLVINPQGYSAVKDSFLVLFYNTSWFDFRRNFSEECPTSECQARKKSGIPLLWFLCEIHRKMSKLSHKCLICHKLASRTQEDDTETHTEQSTSSSNRCYYDSRRWFLWILESFTSNIWLSRPNCEFKTNFRIIIWRRLKELKEHYGLQAVTARWECTLSLQIWPKMCGRCSKRGV